MRLLELNVGWQRRAESDSLLSLSVSLGYLLLPQLGSVSLQALHVSTEEEGNLSALQSNHVMGSLIAGSQETLPSFLPVE